MDIIDNSKSVEEISKEISIRKEKCRAFYNAGIKIVKGHSYSKLI